MSDLSACDPGMLKVSAHFGEGELNLHGISNSGDGMRLRACRLVRRLKRLPPLWCFVVFLVFLSARYLVYFSFRYCHCYLIFMASDSVFILMRYQVPGKPFVYLGGWQTPVLGTRWFMFLFFFRLAIPSVASPPGGYGICLLLFLSLLVLRLSLSKNTTW